MTAAKNSKNYIDGERFDELAVEAQQTGDISNELVDMFYTLAKKSFGCSGYSKQGVFDYLDADDLVQEAVMAFVKAVPKFQVIHGSALSFYRMVCSRTFGHVYAFDNRLKRKPPAPAQVLSLDVVMQIGRTRGGDGFDCPTDRFDMEDFIRHHHLEHEPSECARRNFLKRPDYPGSDTDDIVHATFRCVDWADLIQLITGLRRGGITNKELAYLWAVNPSVIRALTKREDLS